MDMGRDGGQNKTDKNADGNGYDDTERIGQVQHIQKLRNDGRKTGAVQGHIDISGHMGSVVPGIKPGTCQNCPDVHNIFSEKGKTEHEAGGRDGVAVLIFPQKIAEPYAEKHEKARVDKGRPDAAYLDIIRDQNIRLPDNREKSHPDLFRRIQRKSRHDKIQRNKGKNQVSLQSGKP